MPLRFAPSRGAAVLLSSSSRGPTGAAATITAGTTTTAAAGTSAAVNNSGSSAAAVFDFTIPRGADAGIKWLYDSSTSMADPGTGDIRFNHATLSSVTAIALSATGSGSDVSDYVATWDDSGSTVKGYLVFREEAGSVAAVFSISAVTDNTAWLQLTVAYVAGSLTLTAGDPLYITHSRTGDPGALGGSTGATDNAILRADGAGGATVQNSVVTIADTTGTMITSGGGNLGSGAAPWGSVFLGSGGVLNLNNGDVTVTHSANALAFAGASSGYSFDAAPLPSANDGAALGASGTAWADVFLASGGVINWNAGNYTLTHSAGLLTANGAFSIGTSNALTAGTIELGHASANTLSASSGDLSIEGTKLRKAGKETIWIPAAAMWARTTNGPGTASRELTTGGDIMVKGLAFDTSTEEGAQFYISFPKSWDKSTITFKAFWTNASGASTETVSWGLSAGAYTDDDAIDSTELGTEVRVSDTWLAQNDLHVTSESSAVTVGNTPIDSDMVIGQIVRSVSNDNMTGDADLLGIQIFFTTNASTDV